MLRQRVSAFVRSYPTYRRYRDGRVRSFLTGLTSSRVESMTLPFCSTVALGLFDCAGGRAGTGVASHDGHATDAFSRGCTGVNVDLRPASYFVESIVRSKRDLSARERALIRCFWNKGKNRRDRLLD